MGDLKRKGHEMSRDEAKEVFKISDLITEHHKERYSKQIFDAIVRRARDGEDEAVRWLTEYGFISLRRHKPPVQVTADVLKGIEAVQEAVQKDQFEEMNNYQGVIELAEKFRFHDTAQWVREHESEYEAGLFQGFTLEEQPDDDD